MPCNIDAKGKAVRLVCGIVATLVGGGLIWLNRNGLLTEQPWLYLGIISTIVGLVCILEGWAGWCALRAMGFKTPL